MQRRSFIKLSSLTILPLLAGCHFGSRKEIEFAFDIELISDHKTGHLVRNGYHFPREVMPEKEWLVVGGGIAGMAAACTLKNVKKVNSVKVLSLIGCIIIETSCFKLMLPCWSD